MISKMLVTVFLIFQVSTCRYLEDDQSIVLYNPPDPDGQQENTTLAHNQDETEYVNRDGQSNPRARNRQELLNEKEPPEVWGIISYHTKKFKRAYINTTSHVAVYFEDQVRIDRNIPWVFNLTSQIWSYMTETYGSIGCDSYLSLAIHEVIHPKKRAPFYREYSIEAGTGISGAEKRNFLEFGVSRLNPWLTNTPHAEDLDMLTNQLSYFVEKSSKQRYGSPSENIWKDPSYDATAFLDIFTYDVYVNLGLLEDAARYKEEKMKKFHQHPKSPTFWFRNWFLPLYTNCGGNTVLNKYFQLLSDLLPRKEVYYSYQLNVGDFVFFWSAAAGTDLRDAANATFGWNETYESQFEKAEEKFPSICYNCNVCDNKTVIEERTDADTTTQQNAKEEDKTTEGHLLISLATSVPIIFIMMIVFVIAILFYRRKIKNLKMAIRALTPQEVSEFFEGDPNVDIGDVQALVLALPFVQDFEISRDRIILDQNKILGSGQFGSVVHGVVQSNEHFTSVAVKLVKPNVEVIYFKAFLTEVKIMAFLGKHPNIVELVGTCTANIKNREIFIAMEFCRLGSLDTFLKKYRKNFDSSSLSDLGHDDSDPSSPILLENTHNYGTSDGAITNTEITNSEATVHRISTFDLLTWSREVANAMVYLTEKKVIHGDLAARNILLTENRVAKISDFGLSHQFLNYANYMKTSKTPVPWRWLAIESMKEMKFSTASDVWAFGVTLWEIFSLGEIPYGGWTYDLFFCDRLVSGDRLLMPTRANPEIYQLMLDCWKQEASERPNFDRIHKILGEFLSKLEPSMRLSPVPEKPKLNKSYDCTSL